MSLLQRTPEGEMPPVEPSGLGRLVDVTLRNTRRGRVDLAAYHSAAQLAGLGGVDTAPEGDCGGAFQLWVPCPSDIRAAEVRELRLAPNGALEAAPGGALGSTPMVVRIEAGATVKRGDLARAVQAARRAAPGAKLVLSSPSLKLSRAAIDFGVDLVEASIGVTAPANPAADLELLAFELATTPAALRALAEMARLVGAFACLERLLARYWTWLRCPPLTQHSLDAARRSGDCVWAATWEWAYGRVISQSDHARVLIRRTERGERRVRKVALGDLYGFERERERHRCSRAHHQPLAPVLRSGRVAGGLYYETPYYPGGTLRDRLRTAEFELTRSEPQVLAAIEGLCDGFFRQAGSCRPDQFALTALVERPLQRLPSARISRIPAHAWCDADALTGEKTAALFDAIALADVLRIDGVSYPGPRSLLSMLADQLPEFTAPSTSIRQVHGDAHFGNILFDSQGRAVFLDAGGFLNGADVAYDVGKMILSLQWHDLYLDDLGSPLQLRATPEFAEVRRHRLSRAPAHAALLTTLRSRALPVLHARTLESLGTQDTTLPQRAVLYAGVHQIAMAPTLLRRFGWRAIAILAEGVRTTHVALGQASPGAPP